MKRLVTIAGPQSSGKTTLFKHLSSVLSDTVFLSETNPASVSNNMSLGALQTTRNLEKMIIAKDIETIKNTTSDKNTIIETGIFHCAFASFFLGKKESDDFFYDYLRAQAKWQSLLIFIKCLPETSFLRRKNKYLQRIRDTGITSENQISKKMNLYKKVIFEMYPQHLSCYRKYPLEKTAIENDDLTESNFLKKALTVINSFLLY